MTPGNKVYIIQDERYTKALTFIQYNNGAVVMYDEGTGCAIDRPISQVFTSELSATKELWSHLTEVVSELDEDVKELEAKATRPVLCPGTAVWISGGTHFRNGTVRKYFPETDTYGIRVTEISTAGFPARRVFASEEDRDEAEAEALSIKAESSDA
jgi:hypothetical protein